MLVPLVFFSISGSKLPGYILPALPPAILLTGLYIDDFVRKERWRTRALHALAFVMLVVVTVLLAVALPRFAEGDSVKHLLNIARERGFGNAQILSMNTVSHNMEFYGPGRLVRDKNGEQWRFLTARGIADHIKENEGKPVLVLIPHQLIGQLTGSDLLNAEIIGRDAEHTILAVKSKSQKKDKSGEVQL
jgi:hypothetical protein